MMVATADVASLAEVLEEHVRLHEALLAEVRGRSRDLVGLESSAIDAADGRERAITERIRVNDGRRRALVEGLGREIGLSGTPRLLDLARRIGAPGRECLLALRDRLVQVVDDVGRANALNRSLAFQGIRHVESLLRTLVGAEGVTPVYGRGGTAPGIGTPRALVVDRMA